MSKISDELRKEAKRIRNSRVSTYRSPIEYERLADRIDHEMVELPKDANDVPISVGDTLYNSGKKYVVTCMFTDYCDHRFAFYANDDESTAYNPESFTHECPDSLETIADELDEWCDGADADTSTFDVPRDLAERIRKLAKEQTNE